MKDWGMWAPLQTKKQREVAENLSPSEKEELIKTAKEFGRKAGIYCVPALLFISFLFVYTALSLNLKLLLSIAIILIYCALFFKFVGFPYRKKQKELLNNSQYAKEKRMTV
jgi:hypothetical protein